MEANKLTKSKKFKLLYFDMRGRAEAIRYIFAYAGVRFQDVRVRFDTWPLLKKKMPFGVLPVLDVNQGEFVLSQHMSIGKYLARGYGLIGSDGNQEALADQFVEATADLFGPLEPVSAAVRQGDRESVDEEFSEFREESLTPFLCRIEKFLADNGTGWLAGDGITWADLYVGEFLDRMVRIYDSTCLNDYKELQELVMRIHGIPQIEHYVKKRANTIL